MAKTDPYRPTTERLDVETRLTSAGAYLIYLFHIASYEFAAARLEGGARVLDFGCGTGYGAFHLATSGCSVVGVDVSASAIHEARARYDSPAVEFTVVPPVESAPLPFDDASFDAVVSFQVIEHVPSVDAYLAEVARVLRHDGTFLCATPDRGTRLFPRQRPWNRWHLVEFTPEDLADAVGRHLDVQEVLGMTAPAPVLGLELTRTRRLRNLSLPFTFPGAPEPWRVAGIEGMRAILGSASALRSRFPGRRVRPAESDSSGRFDFGPDDIVIAPGANPSTNIVLSATRRTQPPHRG